MGLTAEWLLWPSGGILAVEQLSRPLREVHLAAVPYCVLTQLPLTPVAVACPHWQLRIQKYQFGTAVRERFTLPYPFSIS